MNVHRPSIAVCIWRSNCIQAHIVFPFFFFVIILCLYIKKNSVLKVHAIVSVSSLEILYIPSVFSDLRQPGYFKSHVHILTLSRAYTEDKALFMLICVNMLIPFS